MMVFAAFAVRMAAIAALAAPTHCSVGMVFGSFTRLNITCALPLKRVASLLQRSANTAFGTCVEPTVLP